MRTRIIIEIDLPEGDPGPFTSASPILGYGVRDTIAGKVQEISDLLGVGARLKTAEVTVHGLNARGPDGRVGYRLRTEVTP